MSHLPPKNAPQPVPSSAHWWWATGLLSGSWLVAMLIVIATEDVISLIWMALTPWVILTTAIIAVSKMAAARAIRKRNGQAAAEQQGPTS